MCIKKLRVCVCVTNNHIHFTFMWWCPSAGFFTAGLNLTEDSTYILLHLTQSMRDMTLQAYTVLMDWVRKQQPGSQITAVNIICADFAGIARNEFCEVVIGLNTKVKRWQRRPGVRLSVLCQVMRKNRCLYSLGLSKWSIYMFMDIYFHMSVIIMPVWVNAVQGS